MAKHKKREKKRKKSRDPRTQRQIVHRGQISITGEANYIIGRAKNNDARVVVLGPLVFFSTETGDAWMLDPEDGPTLHHRYNPHLAFRQTLAARL